ncbi:hypothetical protein B1A_07829, partial [mine drainage metagenome]
MVGYVIFEKSKNQVLSGEGNDSKSFRGGVFLNEKIEDFSRFDPLLGTLLKMGKGRLKIYMGWAPGTGKTRRALLDLQ